MSKSKFKLYYLGLILVFGSLAACQDENEALLSPIQQLIGTWEWESSIGGLSGDEVYTPENTNAQLIYIFKADGTFYQLINGDTTETTDYFVRKEESLLIPGEFQVLSINHKIWKGGEAEILRLRHRLEEISENLVMNQDVTDGFRLHFKKIK